MDFCRTSGNRSGLFPVRLGQRAQLPAAGSKVSSCGSNGAFVMSRWISLNPLAEFPHRDRFGFLVFQKSRRCPVLREAFREGAALIVRLQSGNLKRMRDGQLAGVEGFL